MEIKSDSMWNERRYSITSDEETTTHCHQRDWRNEYWVTLSAICLFHMYERVEHRVHFHFTKPTTLSFPFYGIFLFIFMMLYFFCVNVCRSNRWQLSVNLCIACCEEKRNKTTTKRWNVFDIPERKVNELLNLYVQYQVTMHRQQQKMTCVSFSQFSHHFHCIFSLSSCHMLGCALCSIFKWEKILIIERRRK